MKIMFQERIKVFFVGMALTVATSFLLFSIFSTSFAQETSNTDELLLTETCTTARADNVGGECDGDDILALWVQFDDTDTSTAFAEAELVLLLQNVTDTAREITDNELDLSFDLKGPFQVGRNFGSSLYASKLDAPQFLRGIDVGEGEFDFSRILREGDIDLRNYKYLIVINDAPLPSGIERGKKHLLNFFTNGGVQDAIKKTGKVALAPNLGLIGAVASKVDLDLAIGNEESETGIETFPDMKVIEVFPGIKNSALEEQEDILLVQLIRSHNIGKSLDEVRANFEKVTKVTDFVLDAEALMNGDILGAIEKGIIGSATEYAAEKSGDLLRKTAVGAAALDKVDAAKEKSKEYIGALAKGAGGWLKQDDQIVIDRTDEIVLRPITVKKSISPFQKKSSARVMLSSGEEVVIQFTDATNEGGRAGLEMQKVITTTDDEGNVTPNFLSLADDVGNSLFFPGACYARDNIRIGIPANAVKNPGAENATISFIVEFKGSDGAFPESDCAENTVSITELTVNTVSSRRGSLPGFFRVGDALEIRVAIENPTFIAGNERVSPTDVFLEIGTRGRIHTTLEREDVQVDRMREVNFEWIPQPGNEGWNELTVRAQRDDDEVLSDNEIVQKLLINVRSGETIPEPVFNFYTLEFFSEGPVGVGGTVEAYYEKNNIRTIMNCVELVDGCPAFGDIPQNAEIVIEHITENENSELVGMSGPCAGSFSNCRFQITKQDFPNPDVPVRVGFEFAQKPAITLSSTEGYRVEVVAREPGKLTEVVHLGEGFVEEKFFPKDTVITLRINPEDAPNFAGWNIPSCGGDEVCEFSLNAFGEKIDIRANFKNATDEFTLNKTGSSEVGEITATYNVDGEERQEVCGAEEVNCSLDIPRDTEVTLTVGEGDGPDDGKLFNFLGWGGACSGDAETCTFVMSEENTAVEARYEGLVALRIEHAGLTADTNKAQYTFTSNPQKNINPCTGDCTRWAVENSTVTIYSNYEVGWQLKDWKGACDSAGNGQKCTLAMSTASKDVIAEIGYDNVSLTISKIGDGSGTISVNAKQPKNTNTQNLLCSNTQGCSHDIQKGSEVTVTANPSNESKVRLELGSCVAASDTKNVTQTCTRTTTGNLIGNVRFSKVEELPELFDIEVHRVGGIGSFVLHTSRGAQECKWSRGCDRAWSRNLEWGSGWRIQHLDDSPENIVCEVTRGTGTCRYIGLENGTHRWSISRTAREVDFYITYPDIIISGARSGGAENEDVKSLEEIESMGGAGNPEDSGTNTGAQAALRGAVDRVASSIRKVFGGLFDRNGATRQLAQISTAGPNRVEVYDITISPEVKQITEFVGVQALIANRKNLNQTNPFGIRLEIDRQIGSSWETVHREEYFASNINRQSFVEVPFSEWQPSALGAHRARVCVGILKLRSLDYGGCEEQSFQVLSTGTYVTLRTGVTDSPENAGQVISTSIPKQDDFNRCRKSCKKEFLEGTAVTLEAVASSGYRFIEWTGPHAGRCVVVNGRSNTCSVVLGGDSEVRAIFAEDNTRGDVNSDGQVTATDALLTLQLSVGQTVPNTDSEQADANCDGRVIATDAYLVLRAAVDGTALTCDSTSARSAAPVTVAVEGNGRLNPENITPSANGGVAITYEAIPQSGQQFIGWTGACAGSTERCTITVDGTRAINATAQFSGVTTPPENTPTTLTPDITPSDSDLAMLSADDLRIRTNSRRAALRARVNNIGEGDYDAPLRATITIGDVANETHEIRNGRDQRFLAGRSRNISINTNWTPTEGIYPYTFCVVPTEDADPTNNCITGTLEIDPRGRLVGATTSTGLAATYALGVLMALGAAAGIRRRILTKV